MYVLIALSFGLFSCSEVEVENIQEQNETLLRKDKCVIDLHGTYIDNGMPSRGENNILVFPSQQSFLSTIENLELLVENYDDDFLNQHSSLNEDELEQLEDALNYNSDFPLEQFEVSHSFYSLRYHYNIKEDDWLANSDNANWTWNDDPTIDLLVEGVEQTVYNPYYEFIVCKTLYKLTYSGIVYIPIDNPNLTKILTNINNGQDPSVVIPSLGGVIVDKDNNSIKLNLPEPSVVVFEPFADNTTECVFNINRTKRFVHPNENNRSINAKQKMKTGPFNKTYKAVTKSYKWKNGKWKKRRTHISAGIQGNTHDPNFGCSSTSFVVENKSIKKKKRREIAVRIPRSIIIPGQIGANANELKTRHHQNGIWHEWYYETPM